MNKKGSNIHNALAVFILLVFSVILIYSYNEIPRDQTVCGIECSSAKDTAGQCFEQKEDKYLTLNGRILPDEGFSGSMLALDRIRPEHATEITSVLKDHVDFRFLAAGEDFIIELDKETGIVASFSYIPDPVTTHKLTRNEDGYLEYELIEKPAEIRYRYITGNISSTLNQAMLDAGLTPSEAAVAYGVLECLVNFRSDARKGDGFSVFLEERYFDEKKLKGGKVILASYDGKKTGYKVAYSYRDTEPNSAFNAHYSRKGEALIRAALRLPVDRVHVTSSFGQRIHPVTGIKTFHYGVDYRGSIGDPVYTVANGTVTQTGYDAVSGKKITVEHPDKTRTVYYHLSKILVKKGQKVTSRQKIAEVGRTGRVTGPHLHFGVMDQKGRWINPARRKMIATPKLEGERYARFLVQMEDTDRLIHDHVNREKMIARYTLLGLGNNGLF